MNNSAPTFPARWHVPSEHQGPEGPELAALDELVARVATYPDDSPADLNLRRAARAAAVVQVIGRLESAAGVEPVQTMMTDLLCELRHLCDAIGLDFASINHYAARHHAADLQDLFVLPEV